MAPLLGPAATEPEVAAEVVADAPAAIVTGILPFTPVVNEGPSQLAAAAMTRLTSPVDPATADGTLPSLLLPLVEDAVTTADVVCGCDG